MRIAVSVENSGDGIPVDYGHIITPMAMLNRLKYEWTQILTNSVINTTDDLITQANAAKLQAFILKIQTASFIILNDPELDADLQELVDLQVLTPVRKAEVINNPVTRREIPS